MSVFMALMRRELGGHFKSWNAYVVIAAMLFLFGLSFVDLLGKMNNDPEPFTAPVTEIFFSTVYFWLILLLTAPVMTMRTYALEKSTGTYEALLTAPVGDWQVVLAKFAGTLAFFALSWLPLLACLLVIRHFTGDPATLDPRVVASTFLGILLIGSLFISMGTFASSLSRSQITAAMIAFLLGVGLFVTSLRPAMETTTSGMVMDHLSMYRHFGDFSRGIIDLRPVVLYLTSTGFFLFLTHKVVEGRRWS